MPNLIQSTRLGEILSTRLTAAHDCASGSCDSFLDEDSDGREIHEAGFHLGAVAAQRGLDVFWCYAGPRRTCFFLLAEDEDAACEEASVWDEDHPLLSHPA